MLMRYDEAVKVFVCLGTVFLVAKSKQISNLIF